MISDTANAVLASRDSKGCDHILFASIQIPPLLVTGSIISGKIPNLSKPWSPLYEMGIRIMSVA